MKTACYDRQTLWKQQILLPQKMKGVTMNCPKCKSEMKPVTYNNIEVDRCVNCEGIWFDMSEHEQLKEMKGSEVIDTGSAEKGKEFNRIDRIKCPKCQSKMIRMVDNEQPHIWYEACGVCYGVFFDAGEFKDFKEYTFSDFMKKFQVQERT